MSTLLVFVGFEDRRRRVARYEQRQLEEVPAVERQRLDARGRQHPIDHCAERATRVAAPNDALLEITDKELDVELAVLADLQRDGLGSPRHKAAQRDLDAVHARRQHRKRKPAVVVAGGRPGRCRRERADGDGNAPGVAANWWNPRRGQPA